MRATEWEFHNRFWIIGAIFGISFWAFPFIERGNFGASVAHALRPGLDPDSLDFRYQLQGIFISGSLLVFAAAWLRTWATAYLKAGVVHDPSLHSEQLVASGPFRFTRNPLYLANIVMAVG